MFVCGKVCGEDMEVWEVCHIVTSTTCCAAIVKISVCVTEGSVRCAEGVRSVGSVRPSFPPPQTPHPAHTAYTCQTTPA